VINHRPDAAERASLTLIDSARDDIEQVLASGRRIKGLKAAKPKGA
jgi:pyoverdine/dityrosine biosynthesis protein Dit1